MKHNVEPAPSKWFRYGKSIAVRISRDECPGCLGHVVESIITPRARGKIAKS
jgi:hypothetical protein